MELVQFGEAVVVKGTFDPMPKHAMLVLLASGLRGSKPPRIIDGAPKSDVFNIAEA